MSALSKHLSNQQDIATHIAGLLEAVMCLKDVVKDTEEGELAIVMTAYELADQLSRNLDCTSLPLEGAA